MCYVAKNVSCGKGKTDPRSGSVKDDVTSLLGTFQEELSARGLVCILEFRVLIQQVAVMVPDLRRDDSSAFLLQFGKLVVCFHGSDLFAALCERIGQF